MLTGCQGSPDHKGTETSGISTASVEGLEGFKTTFYAFTKSQNCVKCHGSVVSPYFASPDVNVAYDFASKLVDFDNPTASVIATYAGNSHCGDTPCSDPANTPVVKELLTAWAAAENQSAADGDDGDGTEPPPAAGPPKYITAAVAVPANITGLNVAPKVMRFQLSQMTSVPASLNRAVLEIEIQTANANTYRINRIKIGGNTAAVSIRRIHVYVKTAGASGLGVEDLNQGNLWNSVVATAPVFALPANLPAGPLAATPLSTTALFVEKLSATDVITIGIEEIQ